MHAPRSRSSKRSIPPISRGGASLEKMIVCFFGVIGILIVFGAFFYAMIHPEGCEKMVKAFMQIDIAIIICVTAFKIISLVIGMFSCYLGYRLFQSALSSDPSKFKAAGKGISFELSSTAPGIFFALFGTVIVVVAIYRGLDFNYSPPSPKDLDNARGSSLLANGAYESGYILSTQGSTNMWALPLIPQKP